MNLQEIKVKLEEVAELLYVNNRVLDEYFDVLGESETTIGVGSDKVVPQGLSAEIDDLLDLISKRCEINNNYALRVKESVVSNNVVTDLEAKVGWSHKAAQAGSVRSNLYAEANVQDMQRGHLKSAV